MKTATYKKLDGGEFTVEYDENAPCIICGEPVIEASVGGTAICPWCDMGKCRYCGMDILVFREEIDGGRSLRKLKEHMAWHRLNAPPNRPKR